METSKMPPDAALNPSATDNTSCKCFDTGTGPDAASRLTRDSSLPGSWKLMAV